MGKEILMKVSVNRGKSGNIFRGLEIYMFSRLNQTNFPEVLWMFYL